MDDNFHGTHLAGMIGAVCNNGIGVCGVNQQACSSFFFVFWFFVPSDTSSTKRQNMIFRTLFCLDRCCKDHIEHHLLGFF